jgi:hypothetical protein
MMNLIFALIHRKYKEKKRKYTDLNPNPPRALAISHRAHTRRLITKHETLQNWSGLPYLEFYQFLDVLQV